MGAEEDDSESAANSAREDLRSFCLGAPGEISWHDAQKGNRVDVASRRANAKSRQKLRTQEAELGEQRKISRSGYGYGYGYGYEAGSGECRCWAVAVGEIGKWLPSQGADGVDRGAKGRDSKQRTRMSFTRFEVCKTEVNQSGVPIWTRGSTQEDGGWRFKRRGAGRWSEVR